jgi:hypothetical protein
MGDREWTVENIVEFEQGSPTLNPPARVDRQAKSPALQNRGQGTQLRFRTYCPGHPPTRRSRGVRAKTKEKRASD